MGVRYSVSVMVEVPMATASGDGSGYDTILECSSGKLEDVMVALLSKQPIAGPRPWVEFSKDTGKGEPLTIGLHVLPHEAAHTILTVLLGATLAATAALENGDYSDRSEE